MAERRSIDLGTLTVERVVVHQVPKRGRDQPPLRLSQAVSPLPDPELRTLIRNRIVTSIGLAKAEVRFDPERLGPTRQEVFSLLTGGPEGLVNSSQILARHLHEIQPTHASAGVLLVAETMSLGRKGISVLKMEPQEGASLEWSAENCSIQRLEQLMLTAHTKLYKIGHFEADPDNVNDPVGFVADRQAARRRVVNYFLEGFLGCKFAVSPKEITHKIHTATIAFINEKIESPESRAHYGLALISELKSNDDYIRPQEFASRHLVGRDRDAYEMYLQENGIDATATFPKDTSLIDRNLRVTTLGFEGGITVAGDPDAFERHVTTHDTTDGAMELTIIDRLKTVRQ